jgi:predicted metal-dependent HD superfamily phosphohydrolase
MLQGFFTEAEIAQVTTLILATAHLTKHQSIQQSPPQASIKDLIDIIRSIDLSILGQEEKIYQQYADQVRAEYQDIPETIYYQNRIKVLELFLSQANQGKLYASQDVATRYTAIAIHNLQSEIDQIQIKNKTAATANHNQG